MDLLQKLTNQQLKVDIIKKYNIHTKISGYSKMNKTELIDEIKKHLEIKNGLLVHKEHPNIEIPKKKEPKKKAQKPEPEPEPEPEPKNTDSDQDKKRIIDNWLIANGEKENTPNFKKKRGTVNLEIIRLIDRYGNESKPNNMSPYEYWIQHLDYNSF
jgi:hypothetical protein